MLQAIGSEAGLALIGEGAQGFGTTVPDPPEGTRGHLPVCTDLWAAVGTRADFAAINCYPTKNLAAFGYGGALVVNRPEAVQRARHRRFYGWDQKRQAVPFGVNSRLDELQAEVVRVLRPLLR